MAAAVLVVVGAGLAPARLQDTSIANPFGLAGPAGAIADVLAGVGTILWAASMVTALACGGGSDPPVGPSASSSAGSPPAPPPR